jgi:hypothetical protein
VRQSATPPFADARKRRGGGTGNPHFNPLQPRGGNGQWIDTGARLRAAIPLATSKAPVRVDFGTVQRGAAVSKVAGADVRGFKHSISDQGIRHIVGRHPDVTPDDIARLPEIVRTAPVLSAERGVNGVPRLEYRVTMGGQRFVYIAEVRRRKRRLEAITFYKV